MDPRARWPDGTPVANPFRKGSFRWSIIAEWWYWMDDTVAVIAWIMEMQPRNVWDAFADVRKKTGWNPPVKRAKKNTAEYLANAGGILFFTADLVQWRRKRSIHSNPPFPASAGGGNSRPPIIAAENCHIYSMNGSEVIKAVPAMPERGRGRKGATQTN